MRHCVIRAMFAVLAIAVVGASCSSDDNADGSGLVHESSDGSFVVTRLNGGDPVVSAEMILDLGWEDVRQDRSAGLLAPAENMGGPSVIRIPDWIPPAERADPTARYYMYFAHHHGQFIRLAWAADIEGPWTLYNMAPDVPKEDLGVLSIAGGETDIGGGLAIRPGNCTGEPSGRSRHGEHVASPFATVDDVNQLIVLYFHAGRCIWLDDEYYGGQDSLAASSPTGLDFDDGFEPAIMGPPYMRPFTFEGDDYAISNQAKISTPAESQEGGSPETLAPGDPRWTAIRPPDFDACLFAEHPDPDYPPRARHSDIDAVQTDDGEVLWWVFSVKGPYEIEGELQPEQILFAEVDPGAGECWGASWPAERLLWAIPGWECGELDPTHGSKGPRGRFEEPIDQVRDPDLFFDTDGRIYLFYAGCGENGIGVAELTAK